ncbi:MAG: hypothetical protein KatS3mg131_0326 [Candidatus Tectimicrobiota bacterium]|nr:MAG: hypothetical protein KatS3mg131_0326 [Candidatus Tectomicrobia bacterium]
MAKPSPVERASYTVAERRVVAQTAELRVTVMALDAEHAIPWHFHSHVTDTFFCLAGQLGLETPEGMVVLQPGDSLAIPPGRPHRVTNQGAGRCRFLLVQGVGPYDFVPA